MTLLGRQVDRFLTWLLGPHCPRCHGRVYPHDHHQHGLDCT